MKKIFLFAISTFFLTQNSALAKTQGSYLGVDLIDSKATFIEYYKTDSQPIESKDYRIHHSNSSYSGGIHYNYALNFGGFFISPGVLVEKNNLKVAGYSDSDVDINSQRLQIRNRYGVKSDIGYDLTDKFSIYGTGGYSLISYRTKNYGDAYGEVTGIKNGVTGSWFYGAGIKIDCDKTSSVNLEFNTQNFSAKTRTEGSDDNFVARYKSRLDVVKIGFSYRF